MKFAIVTFGCRVNQADSIGFEEELRANGAAAASPDAADLVIVNTCSVTATSDQGARQTIRRISRDNPNARIVVTGCYATRNPQEVAALPNVARVIANDDKPRIIPLLSRAETAECAEHAEKQFISADSAFSAGFSAGTGPCGATIEPGVAGRTAYTLRVQTGCDEPCAYCIIPSTRGASRSVPAAVLLREVERVTAAGFKEIALTGVHLGSYGRDLRPATSLIALLWELDNQDQDVLFRISSLEPMDCTADIVYLVATSERFAPHFHLPLQHGSNRVLAAMRRPYTIEYYAALVDDIRRRIPSASIGSDIIVGFPGETAAEFEQLASYLESSPLTHVHVFPYSDRPGTAATSMPNKVHGAVIRERARRIRDIGARLTQRFRDAQVGTIHRALTLEDGSLVVTGNYQKLRIPPGPNRNQWVQVRIVGLDIAQLI
jgi:threonylcarbamoyladenosine tRNA methylthiotransferase MtaB